jgi:hypothetical protein
VMVSQSMVPPGSVMDCLRHLNSAKRRQQAPCDGVRLGPLREGLLAPFALSITSFSVSGSSGQPHHGLVL